MVPGLITLLRVRLTEWSLSLSRVFIDGDHDFSEEADISPFSCFSGVTNAYGDGVDPRLLISFWVFVNCGADRSLTGLWRIGDRWR